MKPWLADLIGGAISGSVVLVGFVSWSFLLTGTWPPQYLLTAASIGGMMSPVVWRLARRTKPDSDGTEDVP